MGFLVARICFLHRLRTDGENMFEKTLVRSTPQKVLTHRHERDKIRDGIGRKMMELGTEEIQDAPEEGARRKREAPIDVGGEQYTLTWSRLRLHLPLGQPCCTLGDQPGLHQLIQIFLSKRRPDPIALDPAWRQPQAR